MQDHGALDRALRLFHAIVVDAGALSIGAIAARADIPLSSAHRLVAQLERRGFVVRIGRGLYGAGPALLPIMAQPSFEIALAGASRPLLRCLSQETGATAHLGILREDMVTYLVKEDAAGTQLFTQEAMQLEAYCSGIGKMLLSSLPDQLLTDYLAQGGFVALTPATIIDPERLRAHLLAVREQNFALDDREISEDLRCLAVPVRDAAGVAIAAVSAASSDGGTFPSRDLLRKVRAVAAAIERRLRGQA